jgi:Domain of unknown function (DUF397)
MQDLATVNWRKSSWSAANGCVEVAFVDGGVLVRDSKDPGGPVLRFTTHEWQVFLLGVHGGELCGP